MCKPLQVLADTCFHMTLQKEKLSASEDHTNVQGHISFFDVLATFQFLYVISRLLCKPPFYGVIYIQSVYIFSCLELIFYLSSLYTFSVICKYSIIQKHYSVVVDEGGVSALVSEKKSEDKLLFLNINML